MNIPPEALYVIALHYLRSKGTTEEQRMLAALMHLSEHRKNYASTGCRLSHLLDAKELLEDPIKVSENEVPWRQPR